MRWTNHIDIAYSATKSIFPLELRKELCNWIKEPDRFYTKDSTPHHSPSAIGDVMMYIKISS